MLQYIVQVFTTEESLFVLVLRDVYSPSVIQNRASSASLKILFGHANSMSARVIDFRAGYGTIAALKGPKLPRSIVASRAVDVFLIVRITEFVLMATKIGSIGVDIVVIKVTFL